MSEIKTVKVFKAVNADNIVKSATSASSADRRKGASQEATWAMTCLYVNNLQSLDTFDATKDVKDIADEVRKAFKDGFLAEYEVPELGLNARTGKQIKLMGKDGDLKWSSWEGTKLPIAYCGDIAKIISAGLVADLIISDKEVAARGELLKKASGGETAVGACTRGIKLIRDNYGSLTDMELDALVKELLVVYSDTASALEALTAPEAVAKAA